MTTIRVEGLNPPVVLAAWYNHTRGHRVRRDEARRRHGDDHPRSAGRSRLRRPRDLCASPAGEERPELDGDGRIWVSYLRGHSLKLQFGPGHVVIDGYDQGNGAGLADRVLAHLQATGSIAP
ncbi:hypothetical protein [Streptomyces syringium]|uniref:hypothetical protein n=1 Tax=Streptomyces syringium TaxID=76729 RepID=UPI0033A955C9